MVEIDENFYNRADEHINIANKQLSLVGEGEVSASMMYSVARFNAYVSASLCENREDMMKVKEETMDYFVREYRKMLEDNLNDYIDNFNTYMMTEK